VAYSLGGLVCKRASLDSRNRASKRMSAISEAIKGIMFLGTPHRGSWLADWSEIPASVLGVFESTNPKLLEILKTNDSYLQSIQQDFLNLLLARNKDESHSREIRVMCLYEEIPMPKLDRVLVSRESATLDGYDSRSIPGTHSNMQRFATKVAPGFKRVAADLKRWTAECR
jgi:protein SERAC1